MALSNISAIGSNTSSSPASSAGSAAAPNYIISYKVKRGDMLSRITSRYIIPKADMIKANPKLKGVFDGTSSLQAGMIIKLPGHKAVKGDTAEKIARKYGMTTEEFLKLNHIENKAKTVRLGYIYYVYGKPSEAFRNRKNPAAPARAAEPHPAVNTAPKPEAETVENKNESPHTPPPKAKKSLYQRFKGFFSSNMALDDVKTKEDVSEFTGVSEDFLDNLIKFEKIERTAVKDPNGRWTVGIGHDLMLPSRSDEKTKYLRMKKNGETLSNKEIYQLLAGDLQDAKNNLKKIFGDDFDLLQQNQQEALIGVVFNVGINNFSESRNLINNIKKGCDELKKNNKGKADEYFIKAASEFDQRVASNKVLPGLCIRRIQDTITFIGHDDLNDMPDSVREKVYENYVKGRANVKNKAGYEKEIMRILGGKLTKDKYGNIYIAYTLAKK